MLPTVMLAGGSRLGCQGRLTFQPAELLKIGAVALCWHRLGGPSVTHSPPASGVQAPGGQSCSEKGPDEGGEGGESVLLVRPGSPPRPPL